MQELIDHKNLTKAYKYLWKYSSLIITTEVKDTKVKKALMPKLNMRFCLRPMTLGCCVSVLWKAGLEGLFQTETRR